MTPHTRPARSPTLDYLRAQVSRMCAKADRTPAQQAALLRRITLLAELLRAIHRR